MEPILWRRAYEKEAGRDGGRGRCWDGRRSSVCHGLWAIGMQGEETDAVTEGGFCGAFWRGCSAAIGGPTAIGSLGCFGILGPALVPGAPPSPGALGAVVQRRSTEHDRVPNSTGLIHGDISISVYTTGFGGRQSPLIASIYRYEPPGLSPTLTGFFLASGSKTKRCRDRTPPAGRAGRQVGGLGS